MQNYTIYYLLFYCLGVTDKKAKCGPSTWNIAMREMTVGFSEYLLSILNYFRKVSGWDFNLILLILCDENNS